jgi:hypothetical protein
MTEKLFIYPTRNSSTEDSARKPTESGNGGMKEAGASLTDLRKAETIDEAIKIMDALEAKDPSLSHKIFVQGGKEIRYHYPFNHPAVDEYRNAIIRITRPGRKIKILKISETNIIGTREQAKKTIENKTTTNPEKPVHKPAKSSVAKETRDYLDNLKKVRSIDEALEIMEALVESNIVRSTEQGRFRPIDRNNALAIKASDLFRIIKRHFQNEERDKIQTAHVAEPNAGDQGIDDSPKPNIGHTKETTDPLATLKKTKTLDEAVKIMEALGEDKIVRINEKGNYKAVDPKNATAAEVARLFPIIKHRFQAEEKAKAQSANTAETHKDTQGEFNAAPKPETESMKETGLYLADLQEAETIDEAIKIMDALESKDPTLSHVLVPRGNKLVKSWKPENHPAVVEIRNAFIRIKKAGRANKKPISKVNAVDICKQTKSAIEETIGATAPKPAPLSITLSDGSTHADPSAFKEFFKKLKQSDEKMAESVRAEYAKRMTDHIEQIKNQASLLTQKVLIASRIELKPKHKDRHPGVRDMVRPFVEKGYLTLNDNEEYVPTVAGTEALALAANKRIKDLVLAAKIRHRMIDGFMEVAKDATFVYQIKAGSDEATGFPKVNVSNVIPLHGKPTVEEKDYILGIDSPPSFIQAAMRELKRRKKDYDEKGLDYRDWHTLRHGKDSDEPNSIETDAINPYPKK